MNDIRIEVSAYSGSRGEEAPRSFVLNDEKIGVASILDVWIREDLLSRTRKRYFKVKGSDGFVYVLYHDETEGAWYLGSAGGRR